MNNNEKVCLSNETLGVYDGKETIVPVSLVSFSDTMASIEKIEILSEKIKATFKVAFTNLDESSDGEELEVVAEYREDKSIRRKLLLKNYSDIDKSSDIYRIIEKLKSRPSR